MRKEILTISRELATIKRCKRILKNIIGLVKSTEGKNKLEERPVSQSGIQTSLEKVWLQPCG